MKVQNQMVTYKKMKLRKKNNKRNSKQLRHQPKKLMKKFS